MTPAVRGHSPRSPRLSHVVMAMKAVTVVNPGVLRDIFFKAQRVCLSARQIICEQARGDLDKINQVVTALANVELVAFG